MSRLFLSEGKLGGLLLVAYELGVAHGEEGIRINPMGEAEAAFFVRDEVAREAQRRLFDAWSLSQVGEVRRLNRAHEGAMIMVERNHRPSRGLVRRSR